jgi:hypothetical protein
MTGPPPPPPPPHGENPRTTSAGGSKLPPGKYDIFIIPPHSSGSGFLYLPSLRPNVNSFAAGFATALVLVVLCQGLAPAFKTWWRGFQGLGNMGIVLLVVAVGVGAWTLGRIQHEGLPGSGGGGSWRASGSWGPDAGGQGGAGAGAGAGAGHGHGPGGPPPTADSGAPPPPPPHGTPPRPGPMPGTPGTDNPKSSWQQQHAQDEGSKNAWEKARDETRKKEEERKAKEAEQKRKEEIARKLKELREKEARERAKREQAAKEKADREAQERAKREQAAREKAEQAARAAKLKAEQAARERELREKEKRDQEQKEKAAREKELRENRIREAREKDLRERLERERALREKLEKEARELKEREARERAAKERAAKEKAAKEAKEREIKEREARDREARDREARDREAREREAKEREAKEREAKEREAKEREAREREAASSAKEEATRKSTYAFSSVGEKTNPWPNGRPPSQPNPSSPAKPNPNPTSAKRPPAPTAKTFNGADDDAYSYRPYDQPKQHTRRRSGETIFTESSFHSYAPSQSTAQTTPPASVREPYATKDPDKIVIKGVYCFMNQFARTPACQLISGFAPVTDGLILRITTEGLFIDDDVRGVPQREWDVKAWTLKLMEVWCSRCPAAPTAQKSRGRPAARGEAKTLIGDDADAFLMDLLRTCKNECLMSPSGDDAASSVHSSRGGQSGEYKQRGLHVLRATIRDQEGKRYLFVLGEEEGWKVAAGLKRLRSGTQARQLGIQAMTAIESRNTLELLGWS